MAFGTFQVEITIGKSLATPSYKLSDFSSSLAFFAIKLDPTATATPVREAFFKKLLLFILNYLGTFNYKSNLIISKFIRPVNFIFKHLLIKNCDCL